MVSWGIFDNWVINYNKGVLQKVDITSCHLAEWRHRSCSWPVLESTLRGNRVSGCVLLVQGGAASREKELWFSQSQRAVRMLVPEQAFAIWLA